MPTVTAERVFRYEADMLGPIAAAMPEIVEAAAGFGVAGAWRAVFEVPTGWTGVPDVLFVQVDEEEVAARAVLGLRPLLSGRLLELAAAVSATGPDGTTAAEVAAVERWPVRWVRSVGVPGLRDAGWLTEDPDGVLTVRRAPGHVLRRVVAVEAKLVDVSGAVVQAVRYRRFADRSVALVDASRRHLSRDPGQVAELLGVGLGYVSAAGRIDWACDAPISDAVVDVERRLVGEHVAAIVGAGRVSGPLPGGFGATLASNGHDPRLVGSAESVFPPR